MVRGTGPFLFVCHGGPIATFEDLADHLRPLEQHFTLVYHDYRGSGMSSTAPVRTYSFVQLADDLDELRRHLGEEQIRVLAHSMGAAVALNLGLRHPEAVRRMVLSGGTPLSANRMPLSMMRALGPVRLTKVLIRSLSFGVRWSWRRPSPGRDRALVRLSEATGQSAPRYRTERRVPTSVRNHNVPRLQQEFLRVDLRHRLRGLDTPILVLYGSRDAVASAGASRFADLPNATFRSLPGVGHEIFADAPDEALSAVRGFFSDAR